MHLLVLAIRSPLALNLVVELQVFAERVWDGSLPMARRAGRPHFVQPIQPHQEVQAPPPEENKTTRTDALTQL